MKKTVRKLSLARETLKTLSLAQVPGGATVSCFSCVATCIHSCNGTCGPHCTQNACL